MLTKTLAATAALSMLVGGGAALAAQSKSPATGPTQPIPYSQLKAYTKASPKTQASKDWWAGSAATGVSTDTSATTPPTTSAGADTAVNPSTMSGPPSMPVTPPTDAAPQPADSTMPTNAAPGAPAMPTTTPPTEPK